MFEHKHDAFGIVYSSNPEDLIVIVIMTDFPYISECNVDAMMFLYYRNEFSQAVCEK